MTKPLEQIQQENRKFILEATLQGNNLRLLKENIADFQGVKLTLSRVLLAISKHGYHDDIWFSDLYGDLYETLEFDLEGVSFNLMKETLEEQSEETQRGINKFFND